MYGLRALFKGRTYLPGLLCPKLRNPTDLVCFEWEALQVAFVLVLGMRANVIRRLSIFPPITDIVQVRAGLTAGIGYSSRFFELIVHLSSPI